MNSHAEKLHTAVRRYCIQRHKYWTDKYGELASAGRDRMARGYTEEALRTFPRYNVLRAILIEVERYDPASFATLDEARRKLSAVAANAQDMFTQPTSGDSIEEVVMKEERELLQQYIERTSEDNLTSVEPLFYRRVLSKAESESIWSKLESAWNIRGAHWYRSADSAEGDVEVFDYSYFEQEIGVEQLRTLLQTSRINKVWELREYGPEYEMELSICEPSYNGADGYWCDESMSWIINASHEGSITIGGWLVNEVKKIWPNWKERTWVTPFIS